MLVVQLGQLGEGLRRLALGVRIDFFDGGDARRRINEVILDVDIFRG